MAIPILVWGARAVTFSSISVSVTTLAASSTIRLGFYSVGSDGGPGAKLYDLGTVDSTTTGVKTISSSFTLGPGWVWLAQAAQGGAPSTRSLVGPSGSNGQTDIFGRMGVIASGLSSSGQQPSVAASAACTGAFPDPFGAYARSTNSMARYELVVT